MNKLLLFSLLAIIACRSDPKPKVTPAAPPTATAGPPFTQEGVLDFHSPDNENKIQLHLNIEIAHDPEERSRGLMWRKKMGDNEGMLFVFDRPEMQSFWMHNTYISLDIIYVNEKFEVVHVLKNVPVLNDTPRPSSKPAQYVIEINAGLAEKHNIVPGTLVSWSDYVTGQSMGKTPDSTY